MRLRNESLVILLLLLAVVVFVKAVEFIKLDVVEGDASNFVLDDLRTNYPGADISIISINEMENENTEQYFEVKAKVTENPSSPCPKRMHIYYNYPVQNFVPQPAEVITAGCEVCTEGICTLAFPEEAIIASHTFPGTDDVHAYISAFSATADVRESRNTWFVEWNSEECDYFYEVELSKAGEVLSLMQYVKS